jgi:hypothetical protein
MKIRTAGPATIPPGGKVKSVHEAKAKFKIDFEDGSSATLCLADPDRSRIWTFPFFNSGILCLSHCTDH